jgi:hypothetical protein
MRVSHPGPINARRQSAPFLNPQRRLPLYAGLPQGDKFARAWLDDKVPNQPIRENP